MKNVTFAFDLFQNFDRLSDDVAIIEGMLELLVRRDVQFLLRNPNAPLLYPREVYATLGFRTIPNLPSSGVYYQQEPPEEEEFASVPRVLRMGSGDCDDLASWRAAECRVRFNDPKARAVHVHAFARQCPNKRCLHIMPLTYTLPTCEKCGAELPPNADFVQFHILTQRGDGAIEDPSLILGMAADPADVKAACADAITSVRSAAGADGTTDLTGGALPISSVSSFDGDGDIDDDGADADDGSALWPPDGLWTPGMPLPESLPFDSMESFP